MPKDRVRLDELVVERGYLKDLSMARAWIMSGKIVVDNNVVTKPGTKLKSSALISLRSKVMKYASRGGYKLDYALTRFGIEPKGLECLDVGASTGGFTDCLIQRGAKRVYAIEVGYGQLKGGVAQNPKVVSRERTNLGDVDKSSLNGGVDLATIDLSYLSLAKALPTVSCLFRGGVDMVALIKPLYEGLEQSEDPTADRLLEVLLNLLVRLHKSGIHAKDVCLSPFRGGRGAVEFIGRFGTDDSDDSNELIAQAECELTESFPPSFELYFESHKG